MLGHTMTANDDRNKVSYTVFYNNGDTETFGSDHRNYDALVNILRNVPAAEQNDDEIRDLINLVGVVTRKFTSLSERVSVNGGQVYFDGDPIDNAISQHILRLLDEDDQHGWKAVVAFLEKVATNPSEASKASLYSWLTDRNFTILPNGDFLAYKGCLKDTDGTPRSVHAGPGIVNGVAQNGHLDNSVGNVLEVQRSYVNADTFVGCSTGLHAGTYEYAKDFGRGILLRVSINPRDVVSVPTDCHAQKLRVCRYTVLEAEDTPYEAPTFTHSSYADSDDYEQEARDKGYDQGYEDGRNEDSYNDEVHDADIFDLDLSDDEEDAYRRFYAEGYAEGYDDANDELDAEREDDEDEDEDDARDFTPVYHSRVTAAATAFPVADKTDAVPPLAEVPTPAEVSVSDEAPVIEPEVETASDAEEVSNPIADATEVAKEIAKDYLATANELVNRALDTVRKHVGNN